MTNTNDQWLVINRLTIRDVRILFHSDRYKITLLNLDYYNGCLKPNIIKDDLRFIKHLNTIL